MLTYNIRVYKRGFEDNRVTKTILLAPVEDWWFVSDWHNNTGSCQQSGHYPNCLAFWSSWWLEGFGWWRLRNKIDVNKVMDGTDHVLEQLIIDSMFQWEWGSVIINNDRHFTIFDNDNKIFYASKDEIVQGDGTWWRNVFNIKVPVGGIIDCELYADVLSATTGVSSHFSNMTLVFSYIPSTPPTPATVTVYVYDNENGTPIGNAHVSIMSGTNIVGDGYTDSDGWVSIQNIQATEDGTDYVLDVNKSGYSEYKSQITVYPGDNKFKVPLERVKGEINWGNIAALGVGVAVIGTGIYYVYKNRGKISSEIKKHATSLI